MANDSKMLLVMAKPLQLEEIETSILLFSPLIVVKLILNRFLLLCNENSTQFSPKTSIRDKE